MKASSIIIYAVVLWALVSCDDARRLEKSLDEAERGSNLTQELRQEVIQHVTLAPATTSERSIQQETTSNLIRDIPYITEDSKIQSLKNDDQVQVSYSRKITIDKDSGEDSTSAQNKSVNSVKNDEISYKLNKTGPTGFLRTDMHISHSTYESSSSSVVYDEEYEENEEKVTKEKLPKVSPTEESKVDLEKKIFEAKKKEKNKKEILESVTVPSEYNGSGRVEKPYKENSISNKLKDKNKDSISEALDDRRSTTIRINTNSDKNSNKSSVSEHDNKPLDSLDVLKIVSSGTVHEDLVNQSVNSVINGNVVNNEYKKNRVKYSLKKAHENVNDTEADNSSKNGNILNEENARYHGENLDSQAAHSNFQNGAIEVSERGRNPFQHQHQTESTPTKLDMFGNPPQPQPPTPTLLVKPSLAFKQQLANKIKGLEPIPPSGMNLTADPEDESIEKTTGKSSTKGVLKKRPKIDQLHSSSEMIIPPTATAWTLVAMRTAAEGLTSLRKPVPSTDLPTADSELLTKASAKYTTISPVSRVKSFVPWSTRLHRTTSKPSPTAPSFVFMSAAGQDSDITDSNSEILLQPSSGLSEQSNDPVNSNEKYTSTTTEQQSVIRTTMELDRNITETSVNLIQSSLNDVMVKDQSSTVAQEKYTSTQSPAVLVTEGKNITILEEGNFTSNVLENKNLENENIIDIKQPDDIGGKNETDKHQDNIEEIPPQVKNITVNEVLSTDFNENINEVKSRNPKNNFNITSTTSPINLTDPEREKVRGNSDINDFDHGGIELDAAEDVKSEEESEEDEKQKFVTTTAPFIELSETTIIPDLDEEEGENERDDDELSIPENKITSRNRTDSNSSPNDTIVEIKPISSTITPMEAHKNDSGFYVTSFDIISKENTTQVVTKTPEEGDKNWYEIDPKLSSNITKSETSLNTLSVEITTVPSIDDTNEPVATTQEAIEETTMHPETTKTVPTSSKTMTPVTTPAAVTVPEDENDSDACVQLHFLTSSFKLCYSQQQIKENIAAQLANNNVTWDQVVVMAKDLEECQLKTLSDEEEELEVYVCFTDKNQEPSPMIRDEFVRRKANTPSINFDGVGMSTAPPGVMDDGIDNVLAAIILSVIAAVCLVLLGILLVIVRKRQGKFNYGQRCTPVSLDDYSLDNISVYNSVRRKGARRASKRSYGNPAFDDPGGPTHPINFAGLANFSNDREALDEEFNQIPMITVKSDELPPGVESKNRYANVIPLPETRVVLQVKDGTDSADDYINANFVKSTKGQEKLYIACQAPLQTTVEDFWRMVWQQQSKVILMLTALNEKGVEKCADYLPQLEVSDCHRLFGDFQVTLKNHEVREKYLISSLQLKNLETNSWREVTHLWYSSWPDQGVPDDGSAMIAFLIEARSYMRGAQGPTVVHCSPGTGRTGTVIAIDLCIRDFETQRSVDIPRTVYSLRRSRAGAVQTKDQYAFIYQVLNLYATKLTGGALDSI